MQVAAILLSAGRSRRMGQAKAWLRLDGETLLARALRLCSEAHIAPCIVVVGAAEPKPGLVSAAELHSALGPVPRMQVAIGAPDGSPIDSLRAGLGKVPEGHAVLLWPVDHPFADAALLRRLVAGLAHVQDRIVLPISAGKHGHPVLFGPAAAAELLLPAADAGARSVVRRAPQRIVEIATDDTRVTATVNTPEQAAALGIETAADGAVDANAGV